MKAGVYHKKGDVRYEDVEIPSIGPGEILLRMTACGVCGTDVHKAMAGTVPDGTVLGHEVAGVIVGVGPGAGDFSPGDRVFVTHHVPCFTCHYCRRGHPTLCRQFRETNIDPGGFAEYVRIPALNAKHNMHRTPDTISDEVAAMVEPVACCLLGLRRASLHPGDSVLIMGAGQIGVFHSQIARYMGAGTVIMSDISTFRLQQGLRLGADYGVNVIREDLAARVKDITHGQGADVVIIAAGLSRLVSDAVDCAARGGTVLVFSPMEEKPRIRLDVSRFFRDEVNIIGSYSSYSLDLVPALRLLEQGAVKVSEMVTHRFSLAETARALNLAHEPGGEYLKIMVHP